MAFEIPLHNPSGLLAGADLSAAQFKFVKFSTGRLVVAAAGTDQVYGVLQNKPVTDEPCELEVFGTTKVWSGAAVPAGAVVMSDASGRAITGTATNYGQGFALEAATAADQLITVTLRPLGILPV